ncbi:MAG: selenocysteine-specific translation elongation factor, partial [Oscillospiraceae bacterium]
MKNIIIGTAGHVDHGKTCLIKALTGIETDRLKEEKKRGITIDIGFAYMEHSNGEKIGIIDVPGHEKFIKNMLAGIGGIDMVMLIISAEEGMMPQTKEHLGILSVLNTKKGIVVITKIDLVENDWLELTKEEIKEELKDTFLSHAPIVEVSAYTGQGIALLKETIYQMVATCEEKDRLSPNFRVPIDRVFTIDGFGTVITGTLIEGNIKVGDEAMIYPSEISTKIRNIQVHNHSVQTASAGQRVAINLANIKKEQLMRGDVVAKKDSLYKTRMIDVNFTMIKDTQRSLRNGDRVHFYYGTTQLLAKAVLLDKDSISSGESAYVQFRLEEEICLKPKDYIIARFYSPMETLGGGVVIDTNPKKHSRMKEDVLNSLVVKQTGSPLQRLEQIVLEYSATLQSIDFIAVQYGKSKQDTIEALDSLLAQEIVQKLTATVYVHKNYIESLDEKTKN